MSIFSKSLHNVPTANSTLNNVVEEVVGNKTDTASSTVGTTTSLTAYIKGLLNLTNVLPKAVSRAASTLPQTAQTAYFTVAGGKVLISDIVGEVVTANVGAGANTLEIYSNPTVGADVLLCVGLDIDGDVIGTMYNITGTLTDTLIATTSGAFTSQAAPIVVAAGTIDLKTSASKAGQTKWTLFYIPIDSGATVTSA